MNSSQYTSSDLNVAAVTDPSLVAVSPDDSVVAQTQRLSTLAEKTKCALLKIIRENFSTQYAAQAPALSRFRDALSAHVGTGVDSTLLADFLAHVPLSNYDFYKPFVDRFNVKPCKKEDVENLLAPGLPDYLATSSATSGQTPKVLPKYDHTGATFPRCPFFDTSSKNPLAAVVYCGCMDVKEIEDAPGHIVEKIPVCIVTGGSLRRCFEWRIGDDNSRLPLTMPYYAVPWAATTISHLPSFLIIHGLFFLTHRDVDRFYVPFTTLFIDLFRRIDEQWDVLLSCIRDGVLPDLEGIDHVREHLQAHFHPDPKRAAELLEIGPPFSREGWGSRVWPKVSEIVTRCGGSFSTLVPKLKFVWGPNISINGLGYGSTETLIGDSYDLAKCDEFVFRSPDFIEFLDVSLEKTHKNLCQVWEVEAGKHYEPVLTTRDGLWRYQLGDVVSMVGFHSERNAPIFKYLGRTSMRIDLSHASITDYQLLEAINAASSKDTIVVQEFTTVVDDRTSIPTLGFFFELAEPMGLNAHLAPQQLFDALVATNAEHQRALNKGQIRLPTIRIVKPGTFSEYRLWRATRLNISSGQIKVPIVLLDSTTREWVLERVDREL